MKNKLIFNKGFTLIEILVVIAIISLLSSVILSSLNGARIKTRDAQRKVELTELVNAMHLYYDKYGTYPANMVGTVSPYTDNFNNMAQILVNEGFLSKIPISPCGSTCSYTAGGYSYFNYGKGSAINKAFIITYLETGPVTTTGIPPSCRQSVVPSGFCSSTNNTRQYCMCFDF